MQVASSNLSFITTDRASFRESQYLIDLFRDQVPERLSAGESVFLEGQDAAHVFEVVEGVLRIFKIISDGRRVITGFVYAGDIVGLAVGERYPYSVQAVGPAVVRPVSRKQFDTAVAGNHRLQPEFFALLSDEMAATQDQMVLLSCKNAEERICSFLLPFMKMDAQPGERRRSVELPMCRQDIADYLGLTIETVSRTFTKLINKGVVSIENAAMRHTITIERPSLLMRLAGNGDGEGESWHDTRLAGMHGGH